MRWTVLVLWTVTGIVRAGDALSDQVADYKKAGEPIELADFRVAPIPDADNAAPELNTAVSVFKDESPAWRTYDDSKDDFLRPLTAAEVSALRAVVMETRGTVIPHIDVAMTRKATVWPIKMESPCISVLLPHLNGQRGLANLLRAHARLHHHDENDAEALHDLRRIIFLSRTADRQPFVVSHLVSAGILALASDVVSEIAPDMKVGEEPGAATVKQVKELIAELLDDGPPRAGMRDGLLAERMSHVDMAQCLIDGRLKTADFEKMLGRRPDQAVPMQISKESAAGDALILMRHSTALLRAFEASADWPTYKSRDPGRPKELPANDMKQHPLATLTFSSMNRAIETQFRSSTDRRLAAVALACRAYAVAHDKKLPASLDDLVPQYLPSVPDDPMATAQPLQYQPDPARPIVYSVGTNGLDDAGTEGNDARMGRWQQNDAVMNLSRVARPAVAPAAPAAAPAGKLP